MDDTDTANYLHQDEVDEISDLMRWLNGHASSRVLDVDLRLSDQNGEVVGRIYFERDAYRFEPEGWVE